MASSFLLRFQEPVVPQAGSQCGTEIVTNTREHRRYSDSHAPRAKSAIPEAADGVAARSFLMRFQEPVVPQGLNQCGTETITESREQRCYSDSVALLNTITSTRTRECKEMDHAGLAHRAIPMATMTATGTRETKDRDGMERHHVAIPPSVA